MAGARELEKVLTDLKNLTGVTFQVDAEDPDAVDAAVRQIMQLTNAYKEKYNKANFIQNLLMDNVLHVDMYNRAKKLHIDIEANRMVFIIETRKEEESLVLETMKQLFTPQMQDYIFSLLGAMTLMFYGFYTAAMEAGCGSRRMMLGMGLAAVYLCSAELARSANPWLYLGGIFWVLTDLCSMRKSEEKSIIAPIAIKISSGNISVAIPASKKMFSTPSRASPVAGSI